MATAGLGSSKVAERRGSSAVVPENVLFRFPNIAIPNDLAEAYLEKLEY